ncbi:MAG TPA: hypothetical protein VGF56_05850 [Rhizomicrobium sp.]|jgi:hypothetical protein
MTTLYAHELKAGDRLTHQDDGGYDCIQPGEVVTVEVERQLMATDAEPFVQCALGRHYLTGKPHRFLPVVGFRRAEDHELTSAESDAWDRQIEEDAKSGALDKLFDGVTGNRAATPVKIQDLKAGDRLIADEAFTCLKECTVVTVEYDAEVALVQGDDHAGFYVACADGQHFLDGQVDDEKGIVVGFSRAETAEG